MYKNFFPKSLFARSLLIIIIPVFLTQIIITTVFFNSIWYKSNRGLARAITSEINTFLSLYPQYKKDQKLNQLLEIYSEKNKIFISFKIDEKTLPENEVIKWYSLYDKITDDELKKKIKSPVWFNTRASSEYIQIKVFDNNQVIQFLIPKNRVRNSSGRIFIYWLVLPSLIFLFISIIFLRNQIRPILQLAKAAEAFGKGDFNEEFRVSGASEIRKAAIEFERMKRRILKHISQRTAMLSGISHDLKTPLTRLKLQIALLNKNKNLNKLNEEIDEMEKMITEYLEFASNQNSQGNEKFNINEIINNLINKSFKKNIKFKSSKSLTFIGRKNLIKRCLSNLINNAEKYGKNIEINCSKIKNNIQITIDDDGPGIEEKHKEKVFRPFYRIDKSRKLDQANVGLGLSIAEDIVNAHGGIIKLLDNPKGKGLRVYLSFPS
jgi:two-component system osmolarity sensor histidine kinase EnvZ